MSIEIERLKSNAPIFHYRFARNISAGDLDALTTHESALFDELDNGECFSAVADWSHIETIPAPLFPQLQHMRLFRDENVCRVIIVGANSYLRALAISLGVITQSNRFTFCPTLDEALVMLSEYAD